MAQAARLNLRLQKELKLLLTDPPPGASFPLLSSSSSLTTIDAQIKGPEGTVYADGLFSIKIQIPERYPFQPPSVTFATPIYHPNIDTGGRICLDILNLPPKGAWQPSLNISTVLTSIGLLLSEPNPDDGLMREASREFKYNRQAFDQKARSMTQNYAQAAASGSVCDSQFQSLANSSAVQLEVETTNHESKHQANESVVQLEVKTTSHGLKHDADESVASHKKFIGINRKLSLESSVPAREKVVHKEGSRVHKDQMEVEGADKLLKDKPNKCNQSQEKLFGSRRKLSLGALSQSQNKSDNDIEKVVPNHCPSVEPQNVPVPSSGSFVPLSGNPCKQGLPQSQDDELIDDIMNMRSKRLCQSGSKQSLGFLDRSEMIKESRNEMITTPQLPRPQLHSVVLSEPLPVAPILDSVKRQPHEDLIDGVGNGCIDTSRKKLRLGGKKLSLGFRGSLQTQGKDNKENVVPQMSEFNGSGSKNHGDNAIAQLEVNNSNMLPHSLSVSSCPSKSLPNQHQDFRGDEKQHQGYTDIAGAIKKKKAEESARPESEAVIVLDSEDSEEEKTVPAKTKSVLARKRLGKWRVRT